MRVGDVRAGIRTELRNSPWVADWSRLLFLMRTSGVLQIYRSKAENYVRLASSYLHLPAELAYTRLLRATSPEARAAALSGATATNTAQAQAAKLKGPQPRGRGATRRAARAPIFACDAPAPGFGHAAGAGAGACKPAAPVFGEGDWYQSDQADVDDGSGYSDGDGEGYSEAGDHDYVGGPPSLSRLLAAGPLRLRIGGDGRGRVYWGVEPEEEEEEEAEEAEQERGPGASGSRAQPDWLSRDAGEAGCPDEASLLQMLPAVLREHVRAAAAERRQHTSAHHGSAAAAAGGANAASAASCLIVDVALDEGRPVQVTFADGTKTRLPAGVQVSMGEALAALDSYARNCAQRQQRERRQALGGPAGFGIAGGGAGEGTGGGGMGGGATRGEDIDEDLERLRKRARLASAVVANSTVVGGSIAERGEGVAAAAADEWHDFQDEVDEVAEADEELFGMPGAGATETGTGSRQEVVDRRGGGGAGGTGAAGAGGAGGGGGWALDAAQAASGFGSDNRCCPPGTLHRISAVREPGSGAVLGLTYRLGRHVPGVAAALADVLTDLAGRGRSRTTGHLPGQQTAASGLAGSLLLLGRPGAGKTTLLRDIARFLADDLGLSVVVVDTSNEIAGGDAVPHSCIGSARRLQVGRREQLQAVMLEAVQNHGPQVVVVDELGSRQEAEAARSISQRGVMLVATAHGTDLRSLLGNPDLNSLVGGLQTVILGDSVAGAALGGTKTRTERRGEPTFRCLVEVQGAGVLRLRPDVAASVDALLGNDTAAARAAGSAFGGRGGEQQQTQHQHQRQRQRHRGGGMRLRGQGGAPAHQLPLGSGQVCPGSLVCLSSVAADGGRGIVGGAGGAEGAGLRESVLPPVEQLRWTRLAADVDGGGGVGGGGGRGSGSRQAGPAHVRTAMCVRLLLPADP
ncbi:hypothetical protein HYH02_000043 [Chlamydomonas schloesseri]|uniref:AAA+ ATPase domain-containing protein n=1 Tax=Chlamydomonas schloesseri TaxID=2026947 RepID=A0A835WLH5_9CHLO|nr:hypothetical protein HYH02_000043 [Chlamydomonas schloesseri]|eukprot:KAG2449939.1 hypothetical protein HYH02_000043 [Chlamydomonas schloesseri]